MKLRSQIVLRVAAVLGVFALCSAIVQVLATRVGDELAGVSEHQLPLSRLVQDVMSSADEYETDLRRALDSTERTPAAVAAVRAEMTAAASEGRRDLDAIASLLDEAVADPRNAVGDRLQLARARGSLDASRETIESFLAMGERSLEAWAHGDVAGARRIAQDMEGADDRMAPSLVRSRAFLTELIENGVAAIRERMREMRELGRVLLGVAVVLGLLLGFSLARRLAARLHALQTAVDAVAAGSFDVELPKAAPDEIGDLTRGFEGLVGRLRDEARLAQTFGRFLDPAIAERLAAQGTGDGDYAERRIVTVLFGDIAGFSALSETLTAEVLVRLLNRVFGEGAANLRAHGGVVDKYIGDAVMGFFAPPFCSGDAHAAGACLAALDQKSTLDQMAPELADLVGLRRGAPHIAMRFGIATGEVVMGTVGASTARSFTVIGDPVNAASRLTGVNKVYGTSVLISEETWKLACLSVSAREIDRVLVSGKSEPVTIFEVLGRAGEGTPAQRERDEGYAKALAAYRAHDFAEAERGFAECLRLAPDDGPARVMRERCVELRQAPPPEDWDGVWHLASK